MNMLGEEESIKEKGSFSESSILKRFLIVIAGATVNILFGIGMFFILASIVNKNIHDGLIVTRKIFKTTSVKVWLC